jgi:hypothetical protein
MIIGFTGTSHGMTEEQSTTVVDLLGQLGATELHHGDCIGADAQAHNLARSLKIRIVVHPPIESIKRAFCQGGHVAERFKYLQRNKHIVDASHVLIAAPRTSETLRSGTWSTVRYARKQSRTIYVIHPDGRIEP